MEIKVNEKEYLLIVRALGVFQNRVGQHSRWNALRKSPRLSAQLSTCDDETARARLRKMLEKSEGYARSGAELVDEIGALRERLKEQAAL